jgi:hypothetical protein
MFNTIVGAGSVLAGAGSVLAGAASRYCSGSDQKIRLLAAPAPAPQHCLILWLTFVCFQKGGLLYSRVGAGAASKIVPGAEDASA